MNLISELSFVDRAVVVLAYDGPALGLVVPWRRVRDSRVLRSAMFRFVFD